MKLLPLTRGMCAIVDESDYADLARFNWCASKARAGFWYAMRKEGTRTIYMHRQLLGFPDALVDHRNHNTLDNRRTNLRVATRSQNQANRTRARGTSKFVGVHKHRNGWVAQIRCNNEHRYLGYFRSETDAARCYNAAAAKAHGEFATINDLQAPPPSGIHRL
jgi:hypothetical protein